MQEHREGELEQWCCSCEVGCDVFFMGSRSASNDPQERRFSGRRRECMRACHARSGACVTSRWASRELQGQPCTRLKDSEWCCRRWLPGQPTLAGSNRPRWRVTGRTGRSSGHDCTAAQWCGKASSGAVNRGHMQWVTVRRSSGLRTTACHAGFSEGGHRGCATGATMPHLKVQEVRGMSAGPRQPMQMDTKAMNQES